MTPGKLKPPYPVEECANVDCVNDGALDDAYLYRDQDGDKLVVFCGDCARYVELNAGQRFLLIAL